MLKTVADVMEKFKISKITVYRWIQTGRLKKVQEKKGGTIYFKDNSLEEIVPTAPGRKKKIKLVPKEHTEMLLNLEHLKSVLIKLNGFISTLNELEKVLLFERILVYPAKTLREISVNFNCSREWVRQTETKLINKLEVILTPEDTVLLENAISRKLHKDKAVKVVEKDKKTVYLKICIVKDLLIKLKKESELICLEESKIIEIALEKIYGAKNRITVYNNNDYVDFEVLLSDFSYNKLIGYLNKIKKSHNTKNGIEYNESHVINVILDRYFSNKK